MRMLVYAFPAYDYKDSSYEKSLLEKIGEVELQVMFK